MKEVSLNERSALDDICQQARWCYNGGGCSSLYDHIAGVAETIDGGIREDNEEIMEQAYMFYENEERSYAEAVANVVEYLIAQDPGYDCTGKMYEAFVRCMGEMAIKDHK